MFFLLLILRFQYFFYSLFYSEPSLKCDFTDFHSCLCMGIRTYLICCCTGVCHANNIAQFHSSFLWSTDVNLQYMHMLGGFAGVGR